MYSLNNVCVVIETLKTGHMSTKNVNKYDRKHEATHKRTQHNSPIHNPVQMV